MANKKRIEEPVNSYDTEVATKRSVRNAIEKAIDAVDKSLAELTDWKKENPKFQGDEPRYKALTKDLDGARVFYLNLIGKGSLSLFIQS